MSKLIIIRGLPGSGKSTLAKQKANLGAIHIEPDMFCIIDGFYIYTEEGYREACITAKSMVRQLAWKFHCDIIYSDVLSTRKDVEEIISQVPSYYQIEVIDLVINKEEASKRNIHNVKREDLEKMSNSWENWK